MMLTTISSLQRGCWVIGTYGSTRLQLQRLHACSICCLLCGLAQLQTTADMQSFLRGAHDISDSVCVQVMLTS